MSPRLLLRHRHSWGRQTTAGSATGSRSVRGSMKPDSLHSGNSVTARSHSVSGKPKQQQLQPSASSVAAGGTAIQFENERKEKLVGRFLDAWSLSVVILCHGYASSKDSPLLTRLAAELATRRLSSLRFDFSGNGESEGVFQFSNYLSEVKDLRAAVLYVREKLQKSVAAIVGHSKGGNVVLLYGAAYDDVPLIVNIAGRFDLKRGIVERFGEELIAKVEKLGQAPHQVRTDVGATVNFVLTKQDLAERRSLDMMEAARKITIAEVLTVHGTADSVTPVEDAQAFAKCIRQHQLFLVDGADHNFRASQHAEAAVKKVVSCIAAGV